MSRAAVESAGWAIPAFGIGTVQKVAYSGTHGVIANPVGEQTVIVEVMATTHCQIAVGETPVATVNSSPLAAYTPKLIKVRPPGGESGFAGDKISAIRITDSGTFYVTEQS